MNKHQETRPWGKFEQFCHNEKVTVKIISVEPNSKLSLQYHHKREEFWRVVSGSGKVRIGDDVLDANVGDEFFIPVEKIHRMMTEESPMQIMEISFGEFDEDDIVRVEDDYNRA